jgi:hypothetical protein
MKIENLWYFFKMKRVSDKESGLQKWEKPFSSGSLLYLAHNAHMYIALKPLENILAWQI